MRNGSVRAEKELDDFGLVTPHGLMQSGLALCTFSRTHNNAPRQGQVRDERHVKREHVGGDKDNGPGRSGR